MNDSPSTPLLDTVAELSPCLYCFLCTSAFTVLYDTYNAYERMNAFTLGWFLDPLTTYNDSATIPLYATNQFQITLVCSAVYLVTAHAC